MFALVIVIYEKSPPTVILEAGRPGGGSAEGACASTSVALASESLSSYDTLHAALQTTLATHAKLLLPTTKSFHFEAWRGAAEVWRTR